MLIILYTYVMLFSCLPHIVLIYYLIYKGNMKRLLEVASRARAGLTVNIVVVGGSVTHGGACKSYMFEESDHKDAGPCSWANRFVIWMRQHYRNPNIHLISLAQPATTTTWILTHFDRVLKRNPDLLIVEYGVNDAIVSSTESGKLQYTTMMRSATELLIRKFLQHNEVMKTKNAMMYLVLQRSFDERSYFYPSEVYYPVCKAYGIPVVSVRDAIWPNQEVKRESLWVTKSGAHPIWFGHQVCVCVILSYSA
jgi:lysophospholipase L1-like esterase